MFPALKPVHRWHCITVSWKTHTHPELTICLETYFCSFFSFGDQQTAEGEREIRKMGEKEDDDVQQRQVRFESRFTVCGMHKTNSTTRMAKFLIRVISSSPITTSPPPPFPNTHPPPFLPCLSTPPPEPLTLAHHMISHHRNCCSSGTFNAQGLKFRLPQCKAQCSSQPQSAHKPLPQSQAKWRRGGRWGWIGPWRNG